MKFVSQNGISVDFQPWLSNHHKFTSLHMYEELGGQLSYGSMELTNDESDKAMELVEKQKTGIITIENTKDEGWIYTIPIFITRIDSYRNSVSIDFVCCPDRDFWSKPVQLDWAQDITSTIQSLYPGKIDIRCETDIQASDLVFHQSYETNYSLLTKLCSSFKRDSVFALGWEGLMIKETMGKYDSTGVTEPNLKLISGGEYQQLSADNYKYTPGLYDLPLNIWEDTGEKVALEDYTKYQPRNLRVIKKFDSIYRVRSSYSQLDDNASYNRAYMNSNLNRTIKLIDFMSMPKYKIGDVLEYSAAWREISWPYKYYLVKSNEFFLAIDGSYVRDENGKPYSWISKLIALEDDGRIALGLDKDPTNNEV